MGYSVKWIADNLGISRDALRYYENERLISKQDGRNPKNNYRDYSDEDIERIWAIKLLISIGFTAKEIRAFMNCDGFDFGAAISKKVEELESKYEKNKLYYNFAKSIKLMGRIPTTSKLGSVRFKDFIEYVRKAWNFYDDPKTAPFMKVVDLFVYKEEKEWSPDEAKYIMKLFGETSDEEMMYTFALHGYYQVLSDMREFGYSSDVVQRVVRLLHEYLMNHNVVPELDGEITPQFIAKYTAPFFLDGDVAKLHERNYGREGCVFIAQALAYYGGYNLDEL